MENTIQELETELAEARTRPPAEATNKQLREDLLAMTQDTQQSREEVRGLRTQWANALTLVARKFPAAPQTPLDSEQKYADFPDFSVSDRTQFGGWIAQLRIVIWQKPASFPDEQWKMRYAFNLLRRVAIGQILLHVREDRTIGLQDLPAFIQLLEAASGVTDRVATTERKMWDIKPNTS